jgi:tetratricopeptide (TPR) repeat protein
MADAEISKRVEFVEEIKNSGVNKNHGMITLEDYEIYYRIASSYVDSKHMDKAIPYINKAIFINPGYYEAKFLLATVYHRKEKIEAAVKGYEELIKINKEHSATFKAYKNLGIIYLNNLKDMRKVTEYFRKSLEIAPHQGEAENMKALIKNLSAKMGKEVE